MELPDLGANCSLTECNRLDFLPVRCDGCHETFCSDHWQYDGHGCAVGRLQRDVQVPVCPLCDSPVPTAKGTLPDVTVSAHIDADCKSDPAVAKRSKVYANRCSLKSCRKKEMVRLECDRCRSNFCLKHRHPEGHECSGRPSKDGSSKAAQAAMARQRQQQQKQPSVPATRQQAVTSSERDSLSAAQGSMSEDEALARALQASLVDQGVPGMQGSAGESEDMMLARALAESRAQEAGGGSSSKSCCVS